jgi:hypothetical protein
VRRCEIALSALGLVFAIACSKTVAATKPSASTTASAPGSANVPGSAGAAPALTIPHATQTKGACRALWVEGNATIDGAPLATGALLDGEHWVDLAKGASVALRHTQTSREFKLIGPSRVLPCRHGAEQLLLAAGQLSTSANLGVRPGAEVLIATPSGIVHYGDAALDVEFSGKGLRVRVKQGEAWVEPESQAKPAFKNPVSSGREVRLLLRPADPQVLVDACQTAAQNAADSAARVLDPGGLVALKSLGARAATHMRDRAAARTACAVAEAALGASRDPAQVERLSTSVAHAGELWQSVPHVATAPKN